MQPDHLPSDAAALRELYLAERGRREQAEALAAQLQVLARVPELNPNPVLHLDADGTLRYANAAATPIVTELLATGPSRLRSQLLQAAGQARRQQQLEQQSITANGLFYLLSAMPTAEDGSVLLFLTDVTAQRRAEQDVAEQREFYETIMAYLPAVVTVLGPDEHYRYVNPYAEPDPVRRRDRIGRTFAEHCATRGLPPEVALRRHRLFERAVSTRALVSWEERWPGPDGTPMLYWLCYYQPVFGPGGVLRQVVCYGFDITTRRLAEARTRQSEAQVKAQQTFTEQVLDLAPNLIYVRDQYRMGHLSRIIFQNRTMAELRGRLMHLTGSDSLEEALRPDDIRAIADADEQALQTGKSVTSEDRIVLPTGDERWFQSVRRPINMADGTVCILGVSTDITDLKAAQHVAEAAAVARENFLANMSHEIRTPLNGVLGMTGLLGKTSLSEQQRNYTDIIQYSGRHLLNVVNDVLDMAKITSGKLELEQRAFNLSDATAHAAEPLVLQAAEKGIRVVATRLIDSCPQPWVVGDSHRINQILLNLLSNAVKFTPAGGTITLGSYLVGETATSLTVEFRVTDTGIGIAPHKLETIFQEFAQAYADTTRQFGGTGLGLSISRALVTRMGGRLTVQSELGQGSSFAFVLALPKASAQQLAPPPATQPLPKDAVRGRRVLLVEDNPVNREVALLLLESHGVLVDEAGSGLEALTLFEEHRYDAILMDIQMPGMNGLDATARIRAHADAHRAATPILALTANAFPADAEKYLAAGLNDTLPKPFDEAELLFKLASLIAGQPASLPAGAGLLAPPPRPRRNTRASALPTAAVVAAPPRTGPRPAPTGAAPTGPLPVFELALLRQTAHGNVTFMNRVLASFHANTPGSVVELHTAWACADWEVTVALAHKLRPSLRLLGAAGLTPWLDTLEATTATDAERYQATDALATGLTELLDVLPREVAA